MRVCYKEPGKPVEVREVDGSLKALQELVGGYIEVVSQYESLVMLCNEEGRINGMEENIFGLYGPVVYIGVDGEEFRGLTSEEITAVQVVLGSYND